MLENFKNIDYEKEQIETLLKAKVSIFGGNLFIPIIFYLIYRDTLPAQILLVWLTAQVIIFVIRFIMSDKILKRIDELDKKEANRYLKIYLYTIFANSFLWGIISVAVVSYCTELDVYTYMIFMLGIGAAAVTTQAVVLHSLFIFLFNIIFIPMLSYLFIEGQDTYYILAFFSFLYLVFVLQAGYKNYEYISNNVRQRQELKEKNSNFMQLINTTIEAIIISDEDGNIIDTNEAGLKLFKIESKEKLLGNNIIKYVPEYELEKLQLSLSKEIDEAQNYDLKKEDGEIFPTLASGRDMISDGKKVRISAILDLSIIKRQEQQLFAQSRLAQMGEMISMIAHQWRQPLGAISTTSINLQMKIELEAFDLQTQEGIEKSNNYFLEKLDNINHYVKSLTTTIDDFRNFYKPNKESAVVSLEDVIVKALRIIKASFKNDNIEIIEEYNGTEKFRVHGGELMQVILNLLKNAQDNFKEKNIKQPQIVIKTSSDSIYICDNGGGIPEQNMEKIFDPYFSTKDEKNGTGLGLYMSKIIIQDHHNAILSVVNNNGGACFRIQFLEEPEDEVS